jgi:hypothetical protein
MTSTLQASRGALSGLVAECDDRAGDHVLWVNHDGVVHLDALERGVTAAGFAERNAPELKFYFDLFWRGDGYVGPAAAKDTIWINRLFVVLDRLWTAHTTGFVKNL